MVEAQPTVRVVRIIARMNVGGPALQVSALTDEIDPRRFEQLLLIGQVDHHEGDYLELRSPNTLHQIVPGLGRSIRPLDDLRAFLTIVSHIRRVRPTIVHTHTAKAGVLGRLAAIVCRVPIRVHTFHGHLLNGYFPSWKQRLVVLSERLLAYGTTAIVSVGNEVRDDLLLAGIGKRERFHVIGPGIDPFAVADADQARSDLGLDHGAPVIGFVGRLTAIKRPDRFIEMCVIVRERFPNLQIVIAGDGQLRSDTERAATAAQLDCRFLGWRADLETVFAATDVVVLTSDNEGTPVSLIEAAAAGRPAVTTDVGSAGSVVVDGETGLVVDPSAAALAEAVLALLENPAERRRLGDNARVHAEQHYSRRKLVDDHVELYERLLGAHAKRESSRVVRGFGEEWSSFDQSHLDPAEAAEWFESYFSVFPKQYLHRESIGADVGCGSGRWARFVAPNVGMLHLIDASPAALDVARRNLAEFGNCRFHEAQIEALPLPAESLDFAYCLGVLHHLPDPEVGLRRVVEMLKPGAPLLVYLYYKLDDTPRWYRAMWRSTDLIRRVLSRMPIGVRRAVSEPIAWFVYWPLARSARVVERRGGDPRRLPLSIYRSASMYTMRTDALDRLGTAIEHRYTRAEVEAMLTRSGLSDIHVSTSAPYWCAVGYRAASTPS